MLTSFFASNCWFAAEVPTAMLVDKNVTRYPPLGTRVNSAKKICVVLLTNMVAFSRGCKPKICITHEFTTLHDLTKRCYNTGTLLIKKKYNDKKWYHVTVPKRGVI